MNSEVRDYNRLKNNMDTLRLTEAALHLDEYIDWVQNGDKTFTQALREMTDMEIEARDQRALQGCVRTAGFPFQKTLDDFDFTFQPTINKNQILGFKDMRFVDQAENILFIGSPGVGKTHLSVGLGIEAARNHRSTHFITCSDLLLSLKRAKMENRLEQRLKLYARYKLLIIDEVGFLPMDEESSKLFFQLISKRYERHSIIITTNTPLSKWGQIFGDPVLANAILDRLLHHCHIIKIVGRSYRTRNVQEELAKEKMADSVIRQEVTE